MKLNDLKTYELTFSFDYLSGPKDTEASRFEKGELFFNNNEYGVFYSVKDGAQISHAVAAKMGREMKAKMFIEATVQLV
ncbi:hypothetical protein [Tsuneonella sp. HG222]